MPIKFHKLHEDAILPTRATKGSAGYDLHYYDKEYDGFSLAPKLWGMFPCGVSLELSSDIRVDRDIYGSTTHWDKPLKVVHLVGKVYPRSGIARKLGINLINCVGIIDEDYYPNEIGVMLHNNSDFHFNFKRGDRIGQLIIEEYFITDDDIPSDQERSGGFGHTGV